MTSHVDLTDCYNTAVNLAKEAGEVIRNAIGKKKNTQTKQSAVDLVTETDKEVEELLFKGFKEKYPNHKFIGEESTAGGKKNELTDAPTWIIDPVDGTMNFVHTFPYVAVSIGLTVNKKAVLGVIYNPILDQMFTAAKDKGSHFNGKKMFVSECADLSKSLIFLEMGSSREPAIMNNIFANYRNIVNKVHSVRSMGSAALNMCAVASGHADAYFEYTIHCWDIAAGSIIVEEAGGVVMDPEGSPLDLMARRVLCASSKEVAEALSKELVHMLAERD